jgi:Zn-dependent peptidase ImmA (M78 family)
MPAIQNEALANPLLLLWARESAGFKLEEAAKKVPINPEKLLACEQGTARLSIAQLRKLSNAYKRPLAFFYLPSPPMPEINLKDFRRMQGSEEQTTSPALRLEIRRAMFRREAAIEMYKDLEIEIPVFDLTTSLNVKIEKIGKQIRQKLKVSKEVQEQIQGEYSALNLWRDAIEAQGVLVFQASIDTNQMRGLSLGEFPLPVILLNRKDSPKARVFTLIHELTHLMLRVTGICDLEEQNQIEVFCNAVAGETLVPTDWIFNHKLVIENGSRTTWDDFVISTLADDFNVSYDVILRRLLNLGRTTKDFYQQKRKQMRREFEALKSAKSGEKKSGFAPPHTLAISNTGKTFAKLVLDSYRQKKISLMDASEYLGVKLKHLPKIEQALSTPTNFIGD